MKPFNRFRKIAFTEGLSFIILIAIAMPLKYFAGMPMATMIVGSLHGILFVAFHITALEVRSEYKKSFWWYIKAFIASALPFGTFLMDKEWKREQAVLEPVVRGGKDQFIQKN